MTNYLLTTEGGDILTTEGGVQILAYTLDDGQDYGLAIDWDGDGEYDDFQEADRLLRWSSERGREKIYRASGSGFNPYEIGKLTITLDNYDGRYNPWNPASPLYGKIMPGRNVRFSVTAYDEVGGHANYGLFTGTLADPRINGHNKTVDLIIEDGWRFLADWDFYRFPFTTSSYEVPGELELILDSGVEFNPAAVAYSRVWPYKYPWGTLLVRGAGYVNIPRHWWWDGPAKGCVEMIVFASLGRAWIRSDGRFDYADLAEFTDSPAATLDEDILLKDPYLPVPWENTRSEVVLKGSKNTFYGLYRQTIASLREPVFVAAGETVDISLRYAYEDVQSVICTRVTSISFTAFANANGSGANLREFIQREINPGLTNITMTATNVGVTDAYITTFVVEGEPVEVLKHQWRFEADDPYREASFVLDNPWLTVTAVGQDGYLEETVTTINDKARIELVGQSLLGHLATVKPYPVVQMRGRWHDQFQLELEDKVILNAPTLGIYDNFRVSKIAHRSMGTPQDVLTTLWLYPPILPAGVTEEWWNALGQIPSENCIAAYRAKGAASYEASLVNLANPGTFDAVEENAPSWDAINGWNFTTTQHLQTGVVPTKQTWSAVIRYSISGGNDAIFGVWKSGLGFLIQPAISGVFRVWNGHYKDNANPKYSGIAGIVGRDGYHDDDLMISDVDPGTGTIVDQMSINGYYDGSVTTVGNLMTVQAVAFFDIDITSYWSALKGAMNAL